MDIDHAGHYFHDGSRILRHRRPTTSIHHVLYGLHCGERGPGTAESYAALMVPRCLQSTGSSGTVALALDILVSAYFLRGFLCVSVSVPAGDMSEGRGGRLSFHNRPPSGLGLPTTYQTGKLTRPPQRPPGCHQLQRREPAYQSLCRSTTSEPRP